MSRRGWALLRAVALAVGVATLSPVDPLVLASVPIAVLLLAFHARSWLAVGVAGLLLGFSFTGAGSATPLWFAERGWALLLAGGFVLWTLLLPARGVMMRSIGALGVALGAVGVVGAFRPLALAEVDWWVGNRLTAGAHTAYDLLGTAALGGGVGEAIREVVRVQTLLYPALLGLASLGALGVAWFVAGRLRGSADTLTPLREFRFSDQLVWVLIGGLALFLLPAGEAAARLGENAMAFMGGLYLLRGVAVLVWLGAALLTSTWSAVLWGAVAVLCYPVVAGAALVIGLGDTWLDLRRRLRASPGPRDGAG